MPSADPEYVIKHKDINFIAKGEGEITLKELAKCVYEKKNYKNLKGTWFKNEDGTINKNPPNQLTNINEGVPDFSLFDSK